MPFVVARRFNTVNRRFAVGARVSESDDLSPHSFAGLKEGGFITAPATSAGEPRAHSGRSRSSADKDVAS
jgi:hypothetical protein